MTPADKSYRNAGREREALIEGQAFARQLMADLLDLDTEFIEPPTPVEVRALDGYAELNNMLQAVA